MGEAVVVSDPERRVLPVPDWHSTYTQLIENLRRVRVGRAADEIFHCRSCLNETLEKDQPKPTMRGVERKRVQARGKNLASLKVIVERNISEKTNDLMIVPN